MFFRRRRITQRGAPSNLDLPPCNKSCVAFQMQRRQEEGEREIQRDRTDKTDRLEGEGEKRDREESCVRVVVTYGNGISTLPHLSMNPKFWANTALAKTIHEKCQTWFLKSYIELVIGAAHQTQEASRSTEAYSTMNAVSFPCRTGSSLAASEDDLQSHFPVIYTLQCRFRKWARHWSLDFNH